METISRDPARESPLLDCHLGSLFAKEQYLWACTGQIRAMGIVTLRDLMERDPEKVFKKLNTTPDNVSRMRNIVKRVTAFSTLAL